MALDPDSDVSPAKEAEDIGHALESGSQTYLIVVVRRTDRPVGYVRINWMDPSRRMGWLRFALGEQRGQGYAKDALRHLLRRLIAQGAHRMDAETYEYNEASIGILGSLGFKREGVKRQAHFDGERYRDVIAFGLLAEDFEQQVAQEDVDQQHAETDADRPCR
jgi:RimJ/RimL family protein N-acetyltransferase